MKITAIICNLVLLLAVGYLIVKEGPPKDEFLLFAAVLAAPIASLIALWGGLDETWPFVYFRRKALEEKKKIESLTSARKS